MLQQHGRAQHGTTAEHSTWQDSMASSPAPSCVSGSKVASKGSRSAAAFSGPLADAMASSNDGPASHRKGSSIGAGGVPILCGITAWCAGDSRSCGRTSVCNGDERSEQHDGKHAPAGVSSSSNTSRAACGALHDLCTMVVWGGICITCYAGTVRILMLCRCCSMQALQSCCEHNANASRIM